MEVKLGLRNGDTEVSVDQGEIMAPLNRDIEVFGDLLKEETWGRLWRCGWMTGSHGINCRGDHNV